MNKSIFILALFFIIALLIACLYPAFFYPKTDGVVTSVNKDGIRARYFITLDSGKTIEVTGQVYHSVTVGERCKFWTPNTSGIGKDVRYRKVRCD